MFCMDSLPKSPETYEKLATKSFISTVNVPLFFSFKISSAYFFRSSSDHSLLAKPIIENLSGKFPLMKRFHKSGINFRRARSPVMPKITIVTGDIKFFVFFMVDDIISLITQYCQSKMENKINELKAKSLDLEKRFKMLLIMIRS